MQIFSATTAKATPWKNGGGVTRELCLERVEGHIHWRMSLADIEQNGAFSTFPDMCRVLTIAQGQGVTLTGQHEQLRASPSTPLAFDGALDLTSELIDGSTQALNIMWNSALVQVDIQVLRAGAFDIGANAHTALYVLKGSARLGRYDLDAGEGCLVKDAPVNGMVSTGAELWVAQINRA